MSETAAGRLQREKDEARALLAEGYAQDWIDQAELDRRLDAVERATQVEEVLAVTTELRSTPSTALVPVEAGPPHELRVLLGSLERVGAWTVKPRTRVRVTFGSATLDLRQATLPAGPIELEVKVMCGSLDIVVPPGWRIDNQCEAILAAVEQGRGSQPAEGRLVRLVGRVLFGSLTVTEGAELPRAALPGASPQAAKLREP